MEDFLSLDSDYLSLLLPLAKQNRLIQNLEPFGEWNHNPNWPVLFLEIFEQTKIGDLRALPEIWKSRKTEILSPK